MAETSGFFQSVNGDRKYGSAFLAAREAALVTNGIHNNELGVTPGGEMTLTLAVGRAWINGYFYLNDLAKTLTVETANGALPRIDSVVLRWSLDERTITAKIITGTPSDAPAAPALVRDAGTYDLKLCEVRIPAGTTELTLDMITDTRLDGEVCGIVSGTLSDIDYAEYYKYMQAQFDTFMDSLEDSLSGDVAGNLQLQINNINADVGALETVHTLTHAKSGTVHVFTGLNGLSGLISVQFKSTDGFTEGDTATVDGEAYAMVLTGAEDPMTDMFVSGKAVAAIIDTEAKTVNFKAGGGPKKQLITEIITSTKDWVAPSYLSKVNVRLFGGGGGGGAGGGGGGRMAYAALEIEPGATYRVTIGSGGAGRTALDDDDNYTAAKAGGITSFGSLLSAAGGSGGLTSRYISGGDGGAGGSGGGGMHYYSSFTTGANGGRGYDFGGGGGAAVEGGTSNNDYDFTGGAGGAGGTYGGGGGGGGCSCGSGGHSAKAGAGGAKGTNGGKGGSGSSFLTGSAGVAATAGAAGTNTVGLGLDFEGTGAAGAAGSTAAPTGYTTVYGGGGGGGYGGAGGNGHSSGGSGGGGGGYGAAGGAGGASTVYNGGGGGGGYGGAGGTGTGYGGGGGGGYGTSGKGGNGASSNTTKGGSGGTAAGGGGCNQDKYAGGSGGSGICIITYMGYR